jgi:hypothetical protein
MTAPQRQQEGRRQGGHAAVRGRLQEANSSTRLRELVPEAYWYYLEGKTAANFWGPFPRTYDLVGGGGNAQEPHRRPGASRRGVGAQQRLEWVGDRTLPKR